jgi:hypothetical protein
MPFEVRAPNRIGALGMLQRPLAGGGMAPLLPRHCQAVPVQDLSDCAPRGPYDAWLFTLQPLPQLQRAPMHMRPARFQDRLFDLFSYCLRVVQRRSRPVL